MIDFQSINDSALSRAQALLPSWLPGGRFQGKSYVCGSIEGGKGDSFYVYLAPSSSGPAGNWLDYADRACKGGDLIALYAAQRGLPMADAAREVASQCGAMPECPAPAEPQAEDGWELLSPVSPDTPAPEEISVKGDADEWVHLPVKEAYALETPDGQVVGYEVRAYDQAGKKIPRTMLYYRHLKSGRTRWRSKGFPKPWQLYNLPRLTKNPGADVFVVEGPKCVRALDGALVAAGLGQRFVATSWPYGSENPGAADFAPIAGRRCVLIPDFDWQKYKGKHSRAGQVMALDDQPGFSAMVIAGQALQALGCGIRFVMPDRAKPDGWDVADGLRDGLSLSQFLDYAKSRMTGWPIPEAAQANAEWADPVPVPAPAPKAEGTPDQDQDREDTDGWPFVPLGYDRDYCYYLTRGKGMIKAIRDDLHNKNNLRALADLTFWEREFPSRNGPMWEQAGNALIRACERAGAYNPQNRRGRGAWYDSGRVVVHRGDRLSVDGKDMDTSLFDSKFVYERGPALEISRRQPIDKTSAFQLQQICDRLFLEKPIQSKLLAGWITVAPICAALRYRPHIWLTGDSGSGKSQVINRIIVPCLGEWAVNVSASTTEASIRMELGHDGRPVMADEFESNNKRAQERVQEILELARQCFSDSEARILKGGPNGRTVSYQPRACFFFTSIGVAVKYQADARRISVLALLKPFDRPEQTAIDHWKETKALITRTITPEWAAGLRARTISMIPTIIRNTEIFVDIAADRLKSQAIGDQLGPMLAGAFSLTSDKEADYDRARAWFDAQDWTDQREVVNNSDGLELLSNILQHTIKVSPSEELSVHELISRCSKSIPGDGDLAAARCSDALKRFVGIRVDSREKMVYVSETHTGLARLLRYTQWAQGWARSLKRMAGAVEKTSMRFVGTPTKAVGIPLGLIGDCVNEEEQACQF